MSGMVYSRHGSGLQVAYQAADERSVAAALREFDPDLRLLWKIRGGGQMWEVVKFMGHDRDAVWICDWDSPDGQPLPLSHGLVQKVKDLHLESRTPHVDVEELNHRMVADSLADWHAEVDHMSAELITRLRGRTSYLLPRGLYRRNTRFKDIRR